MALVFLAGCCAAGLGEPPVQQETAAQPVSQGPECYSYAVLQGDRSIEIEWLVTAVKAGDVLSVERSLASMRKFVRIKDIEAHEGELAFCYRDTRCLPGGGYRYRVVLRSAASDPKVLFETGRCTAFEVEMDLYPGCPNPFGGFSRLRFSVAEKGRVSLMIYSIDGRLVRTIVDSVLDPGPYEKTWDGRDAAGRLVNSGVYFCRLRAGGRTVSRKLVLMR